jgi:radical SAM protein with 4Fe4S-binding SPASM domain
MSDGAALSALDVLDRLENETGRPLAAMLELSDRCNEVCVHCYQVQGQKGELSTTEWRTILDKLAEAGVLILTLSGGEVTLRKDFIELLTYARKQGFALRIFTNGLSMTRELAAQLADHDVMEVEISVYSPRAEVHDFITGVPGSFDKTVRGIRYLRERDMSVTIKSPVMSVNQRDLQGYPAFAESLGVNYRFDTGGIAPREGFDRAPQALNPEPTQASQLEREIGEPVYAEQAASAAGSSPATRQICGAAASLHVEPNGEMRPCTLLEVDLGNLRGASPSQIFESDKARAMRELQWGDLQGCRVCELARGCSRCHAVALAETGEALGPYPSACAAARGTLEAEAVRAGGVRFVASGSRAITLGPYRLVAPGVYEAFDDPRTADDDALAARLGWSRRSEGGNRAPDLAIRPGELVQIRRPGRKAGKLERVPGLGDHEHAAGNQANPSTPAGHNAFAQSAPHVRED